MDGRERGNHRQLQMDMDGHMLIDLAAERRL
jgi:hypothetical protein